MSMDRRDFIKLTAITGTSATLASCGSPEHQLIRFVPDEDLVPGVAEWKPSVCPACAAGCAVNVRVMEADVETVRNGQAGVVKMGVAKKLEGLPKDPINQGSLCARGQASIQITYHPDRLTQPMKRSGARGSGDYTPVSRDQGVAEQEPQAKLIFGRPVVQRFAAKRHHHPGKSCQRHRDLSSGRESFTWFHRFRLDRIQLASTNTKFGRVGCLEEVSLAGCCLGVEFAVEASVL